jgi:hypothetical protein
VGSSAPACSTPRGAAAREGNPLDFDQAQRLIVLDRIRQRAADLPMDTSPPSPANRFNWRASIIVGIISFAGLMELRYELSSVWARAAAAGAAAVVLVLAVVASRRSRA